MPSRKNVTIGITINLDNYENLRLEVSGDAEDAGGMEELIAFLDTLLLRLGHGDVATAERVESYRRRVLQRSTLPPGAVAAARAKASLQGVPRQPAPAPAATAAPARAAAQPAPQKAAEPAPAPVRERTSRGAVMGVDVPPSPLDEIVAASDAAALRRQGGEAVPRAMTMEDVVQLEEEAEREAAAQAPAGGAKKAAAPAAAPRGKEAAAKGKKPAPAPAPEAAPLPEAGARDEPAGDVLCQECGEPVGKSQQKLSQLFMGKVLCRKCMNP